MSEQPTPDDPGTTPPGEPAIAATRRRPQRWTAAAPWIAIAIAVAVIAVDQLTKLWAEQALTEGERMPLLGDLLGIQLAYNAGAAFSFGTGATWIFTILAGVGTIVALWFASRVRSRAWAICLGLLLGGATTHFLDRLLRAPAFGQGHVVDFIAYFDWFIGNIADIAIFAGAVMLLVLTALGIAMRPDHPNQPQDLAG
ncbi:signal peptidase II [Agromyces sp. NPDC058484]|uniref:signal peptidase II n=1 Tax=Agromyces sp. NPDC058484 TaxID=3346524 RepID=UPI003662BE39